MTDMNSTERQLTQILLLLVNEPVQLKRDPYTSPAARLHANGLSEYLAGGKTFYISQVESITVSYIDEAIITLHEGAVT